MASVILELVAKVLLGPRLTVGAGELGAGVGLGVLGEVGAGTTVELDGCPVAGELGMAGGVRDGAVVLWDGDVGGVGGAAEPVILGGDDAMAGLDEDVGAAEADVAVLLDKGVVGTTEPGVLDGNDVMAWSGGGGVGASALASLDGDAAVAGLDGGTLAVPESELDEDMLGVPELAAVGVLHGDGDMAVPELCRGTSVLALMPCPVSKTWRRELVSKKEAAGPWQGQAGPWEGQWHLPWLPVLVFQVVSPHTEDQKTRI